MAGSHKPLITWTTREEYNYPTQVHMIPVQLHMKIQKQCCCSFHIAVTSYGIKIITYIVAHQTQSKSEMDTNSHSAL